MTEANSRFTALEKQMSLVQNFVQEIAQNVSGVDSSIKQDILHKVAVWKQQLTEIEEQLTAPTMQHTNSCTAS